MDKIQIKQGQVINLAAMARDEKAVAKARQLIVDLVQTTMQLTRKDIADWRQAWQMAISIERPSRYRLYQIYTDNLIDLHLIGATRQRKLNILSKPVKIVDRKTGKVDEDLTDILKARWFRQYCSLAMDSLFWGHSLIQFGDRINSPVPGFTNCTLVPREHVNPRFGTLLKNVSDDPAKGIKYRDKYADWALEAGEPDDLGLLNAVSPHCISKRNMFAFWDAFGEMFGMPVRIGKTLSRDKKDIDQVSDMLEQMGSAAWGVFPDGTEIEIKETSRGDAFEVYDKRIERANTEMSKGILGVTMTIDEGSSRSQSEVHYEVAENVTWSDGMFLTDEINDSLLPFLSKHGFKTEGKKAEFDDTYEYSSEEMTDIEKMILENFEVDPQYFIDKYDIRITGKKTIAMPGQLEVPEKKKTEPSRLMSLISSAYAACPDCGGHIITLAITDKDIEAEADRIARAIITGDVIEGDIMPELAQKVAEILRKAMLQGFGKDFNKVTAGTPEATMLENLDNNVYSFSVAKNYQEIKEATSLLKDGDRIRPFAEFKREIVKLHTLYNKSWLETEYATAISSAQTAAQWASYEEGGNENMLQYVTVGDKRVRDSHRSMDGVKKPINDPFWNSYYPPNGWNCRCSTKVAAGKATPDDKIKYAKIDKMWQTNTAKQGVIFPPDHPYWEGVPDDVLAKAADLKPKDDK